MNRRSFKSEFNPFFKLAYLVANIFGSLSGRVLITLIVLQSHLLKRIDHPMPVPYTYTLCI